jgi:class 3 adenylate cyclase
MEMRAEEQAKLRELTVLPFPRRVRKTAPPLEGLLGLVVTDLEAFTAWVSRLGDAHGRMWIREHNRLMREAIAACDGCEVTHTGDGMIAAFRSLHAALRCTKEIHARLAEYSRTRFAELGPAQLKGLPSELCLFELLGERAAHRSHQSA